MGGYLDWTRTSRLYVGPTLFGRKVPEPPYSIAQEFIPAAHPNVWWAREGLKACAAKYNIRDSPAPAHTTSSQFR